MITIIKEIRPMFNGIVTTLDKYPMDLKTKGGIIDSSKAGAVKEYQKVIAVGPIVKGIEVGDTVFINPKRYAIMEHKEGSLQDGIIKDNPVVGYKFDIVEIEGVEHLYLFDNDIKYVAKVEEFDEDPKIYVDNKILN